jgi:hypothetical protein
VIVYLLPEHLLTLERLRLRRLERGEKVTKSRLLAEAIDLLAARDSQA